MKKFKCFNFVYCYVFTCLFYLSCSNNTLENKNHSIGNQYSTSEVFDGIILAKGPLANELHTLDPNFTK